MSGSARIIRGNALALPLADASVDLVVTSPPYFGLRSYQDGGEHYAGQIGAEPTPAEFVDALIAATHEMVRVLKPSGSIWVNLGDKYAGGGGSAPEHHTGTDAAMHSPRLSTTYRKSDRTPAGLRAKSLIGIPWRYALRCIDDLGLILRAEVIWAKPNGLPESVTDRVRRSHETWFHFVRSPRYFSAVDEIREAYEAKPQRRFSPRWTDKANHQNSPVHTQYVQHYDEPSAGDNPLGKLPGSVWTIATQPLQVPAELGIDHFAAFPMEWPRRIIQGWSPAGVCTACGEGRRPVGDRTHVIEDMYPDAAVPGLNNRNRTEDRGRRSVTVNITGYACACTGTGAPTVPSVVLDPFGGTGTTALVAKALGRTGISVDMSADYCRLATWRTTNPGQMAAALQVEKPEAVSADQLDLFGDVA